MTDRFDELARKLLDFWCDEGVMPWRDNQEIEELAQALRDTWNEALEAAAGVHESVSPASDEEREHGDPGAGAMGAVIEYRDKVRALKLEKP